VGFTQFRQGLERLAMPLPLQHGGIHLSPAGPALTGALQPTRPGVGQRAEHREQLPQRRFFLRGNGHLLMGTAGPGQQPPAKAFMQLEQTRSGRGQAAAQLLPVARLDHHGEGLAQQRLQQLPLRHHQLVIRQSSKAPSRHQLLVRQQPELARRRRLRAFPAGEAEANRLQPRQFHLKQPLPQHRAHHHRHALGLQSQGHEQAQQPAGITAGGQADQGLVGAAQAAGHQPAQGEVMGPARFSGLAEQSLELVVGPRFQHREIVGSWPEATVQR